MTNRIKEKEDEEKQKAAKVHRLHFHVVGI